MKSSILFTLTFIAFWLWIYGYSVASGSVGATEDVQINATNIWMLCDAAGKSLFCISLAFYFGGYLREWFIFLACLSLNNVLDEIYFDPFSLGWNEAVIFVLLVAYYSHKITRLIYGTPK